MINKIEKLIEFAEKNSWKPKHSSSLIRRFLTELISSEAMIFELSDQKGLIALAVLLDKINNPANDASLEILGIREGADIASVFKQFISLAENQESENRSGFQVGVAADGGLDDKFFTGLGLKHYFNTYRMRNSNIMPTDSKSFPAIVNATVEDLDQIYSVLCKSFAQNADTSIPNADTWKEGFFKPKSHFYIWQQHNQICGFANLIESDSDKSCELRTMGVLTEERGHGIGQALLNHCLKESLRLGFRTCYLSVAAANEKALGLYQRAGFTKVEKYCYYRMPML